MKRILRFLLPLCLLCIPVAADAGVRLPGIFGDHMVIQRDEPVRIWGWAVRHEKIEVRFDGRSCRTRADNKGAWEVTLPPVEAGGPYTLTVCGRRDTLRYGDILVGEVWLCSGQSNMEWSVALAGNAAVEIAAADHPQIRSFHVPKRLSWRQADDLSGAWEVCSPATAGHFSAVAYYYARELQQALGVPVGIVDASWGGSAIEGWIAADTYLALPNSVRKPFDQALIASVGAYSERHPEGLDGYSEQMLRDPGMAGRWYDPGLDDSAWEAVQVPEGSTATFGAVDGLVWFRYSFSLPAPAAGKPAVLHLGRIDDNDITWVNGVEVGRRDGHTASRDYAIPAGLLKAGRNTIAVRIADELGPGGFMDAPGQLRLETGTGCIPLAGGWKQRPGVTGKAFYDASLSPNSLYSMLFNAMVAPLVKFCIRGVIWYQGESNVERADAYRTLFPTMIADWRARWGKDFPFYWVQLPNFMGKDDTPAESAWAALREAQSAALSLPHTGQAVAIDLGEADDIHPANKQDVGRRLALLALNKTYGHAAAVCCAPTFSKAEVRDGQIIVTFATHGSGLTVRNKYGYVEGFAVAGADRRFVWAKAFLRDGRVVVCSDRVKEPVAVRFAWGDNPDVNLYNTAGLPATPFRTDNW